MASAAAPSIGIIGAGAWGTALAVVANRAGSKVTLWSRNENVVESVEGRRINDAYLPDIFIDPEVGITTELSRVCEADYLMLTVPSQYVRAVCISISDMIASSVPIVICTKGFERGSLSLMSEVVASILPSNPLMVLSGPNFAVEAALGMPTATAVACTQQRIADKFMYAIGGKFFRPYYSSDVVGTQIGGAVKNVVAIAAGICSGKSLGENARAALIARGLAEMKRMVMVKGGQAETVMGLSGLGDLVLSCSSLKSRNMALGFELGQGVRLADLLPGKRVGLTEGVLTAESIFHLAQKLGVSMPICSVVHHLLQGEIDASSAIEKLLERPFSAE